MGMTLAMHVLAGMLALTAGYVALYSQKGTALHRRSGMLSVYAMSTMCAGGFALAIAAGNNWTVVNASAAVMTSYLVLTSLTTVRPLATGSHWFHLGALVVALAVGVTDLALGADALSQGGRRLGVPAFPFFLFGVTGLLASAGDLRMMRQAPLVGAPRLVRHLWRMSFALLIAAMSFFFGQARVIPEPIRSPALLALPVLAVLVTMLYWLWRIRIRQTLRGIVCAGPHHTPVAVASKKLAAGTWW
jgi:uncharacterized membrane protein